MLEDNHKDYFTDENVPEEPKPQQETADERIERELRETTIERKHNHLRTLLLTICGVALLLIIGWVYTGFFSPAEQGQERGIVTTMASKGTIFKTYECQLVATNLNGPDSLTYTKLHFSVLDDSVASQLVQLANINSLVTVEYQRYNHSLPWRGEAPAIITRIVQVDSLPVDPLKETIIKALN